MSTAVIVEDEQAGKQRASYGKRVLEGLAERLQAEFGKGFDQSNLRNMRAFFVTYPIRDALRRELSWTHYRLLLRVDNQAARAFYEAEAVIDYYERELTASDENRRSGSCSVPTRARRWSGIRCPRGKRRSSPRGTSSIYRRRKSWRPSSSASASRSSSSSGLAGMPGTTVNDQTDGTALTGSTMTIETFRHPPFIGRMPWHPAELGPPCNSGPAYRVARLSSDSIAPRSERPEFRSLPQAEELSTEMDAWCEAIVRPKGSVWQCPATKGGCLT